MVRVKMVNNYLTGKCLVSMPHIDDDVFSRSVVYICMHNQEGAMGFMVNKQLKEFYFSDLISQFNIGCTAPVEPIVLHQGGPLERIRGFVLHSLDYRGEGTLPIDDKFAVSSSVNVLNDIAFGKGPRYNLIALGYSSWSPRQLEQEIIYNNWLVVEPSPDLLFKTKDEEKWQRAVDELGRSWSEQVSGRPASIPASRAWSWGAMGSGLTGISPPWSSTPSRYRHQPAKTRGAYTREDTSRSGRRA